jgi:hypothetical protein
MRELPDSGPLLLPTFLDLLAPVTRGCFASAFRLVLLGLVLLVPVWLCHPRDVPLPSISREAYFQEQAPPDPAVARIPLEQPKQGATRLPTDTEEDP